MSKLLLAISLFLINPLVLAQLVPADSVSQAKAQAELKCTTGCLVLSPLELATIEKNIAKALKKAYEDGLKGWGKVATN